MSRWHILFIFTSKKGNNKDIAKHMAGLKVTYGP